MAWKRPDALARKRSSYPTASLAPEPAASTSRCGHSISTGATARNSGPGKSPLLPMRASSIASSATTAAMRSPSSVEQNGSTGMKSTVPAIVVLRPSLAKRVMRWMPDSPAVSLAQLSALPAPSEVITPMPVTTTTRCPLLPHAPQCSRDCAGRARRSLRQHPQQPPERLRVARLRMPARLQNEECPERAEHHALLTLPDRLEASAQHVSARVIEQQQVLPLA